MKPEQRQQFLIVLTIVAAGLFVGVNYIITPLAGLWSDRSAQIRELRTRVGDGKKLVAREAGVRSRWSGMLTNSLPDNTSLAEQQMLKSLDNWARGSGSEIISIMPQWKNDSTNYMTLNCRVEATGTLGTLSQLIYRIEKGPSALKLDSVELSARDNAGQQLTLGMQLSGLALLQSTKK
ncbi:MAG TPA: type 4a pilus biogenesis protein PilO [Verrucomicrobiae bacterium]|nr:type 4a pilus biogenesis protein PilO [Verrucomicrobiae bacterium]